MLVDDLEKQQQPPALPVACCLLLLLIADSIKKERNQNLLSFSNNVLIYPPKSLAVHPRISFQSGQCVADGSQRAAMAIIADTCC